MTNRPPKTPNADYEVGRARPPKATQFQKGQSGNPDGRPRGSKLSSKSPIEKLVERGVMLNVDGKRKRVRLTDFTAVKLVQQANAGSVAALRELNRMAEAQRRLGATHDLPTTVNFNVIGLDGGAKDALVMLELAAQRRGFVQLRLPVVAFGVQQLGRPLTEAEQKLLGRACPEFPAWYAGWRR